MSSSSAGESFLLPDARDLASGSVLQDNLPDTDNFDVVVVRGYLLPTN